MKTYLSRAACAVYTVLVLSMICLTAAGAPAAGQGNVIEQSCGQENTGGKRVLIAYDGKHGSTQIVAGWIAQTLCDCGFQVDTGRARYISDLSGYDAVVAGSPIYFAKFLPGTSMFLKKHEQELAAMPVAFFILSTLVDEQTGLVKEETKAFFVDKELARVPSIAPVGDIGMFGGEFTFSELYPVEVLSMNLSNYKDGDYLNAGVVAQWAENLCGLFK